jgi:outer membrane protein assembly factor BamB
MAGFWRQFHGGPGNRGFAFVSTQPANSPKWRTEIGQVGYASPAVSLNGMVYVGTLNDELVAINPNGTIAWRREMTPGHGRSIMSGAPAIDGDGNIYIITTKAAQATDHRDENPRRRLQLNSTLHSFDPAGNRRWFFNFPSSDNPDIPGGFTFSAPKIFTGQETFIFVPVRFAKYDFALDIMVLDQAGEVVHRRNIVDYPPSPIVGESNIDDILSDIWDFISSPIDFDVSGVDTGIKPLEEVFGWAEPTLAIADFSPHNNRPIIIIEDGAKTLAAFRFQNRRLTKLWSKTDSKFRGGTSPAAFVNGTIAVGRRDGTLALYHLRSGDEYAKPWYKAKKPIYASPVSFGRQIYFVAKQEVIMLESDGQLLQSFRTIGTSLAAPALSGSHLFVSAQDGLWTFNFDVERVAKNDDFRGGVSSPAIADDGTVYAIDLEGVLWAFGGRS